MTKKLFAETIPDKAFRKKFSKIENDKKVFISAFAYFLREGRMGTRLFLHQNLRVI